MISIDVFLGIVRSVDPGFPTEGRQPTGGRGTGGDGGGGGKGAVEGNH